MHPKYSATLQNLLAWFPQAPAVHGAILLGSQVRPLDPGDEWSDLDILLLVDDPGVFIESPDWLERFGEVVCRVVEQAPLDFIHLTWTVVRALYSDNRALDFSILPAGRVDDVLMINAEIHIHGCQVIYDPQPGCLAEKLAGSLAAFHAPQAAPPGEGEFAQAVADLLFQLVYAAKKIRRQELWVAAACINGPVNRRLLQLIEAHPAVLAAGSGIRYEGRFLEQRLSPAIRSRLAGCCAHYDEADARRALGCVLQAAGALTREICAAYGFSYPQRPFDQVARLISAI